MDIGDPQSYGLVQLCLFDSALELQRFGRPMGAPTVGEGTENGIHCNLPNLKNFLTS